MYVLRHSVAGIPLWYRSYIADLWPGIQVMTLSLIKHPYFYRYFFVEMVLHEKTIFADKMTMITSVASTSIIHYCYTKLKEKVYCVPLDAAGQSQTTC